MVHDLRLGEEFFAMLAGFDAEIAGRVAAAGCRHCGGPLYQAELLHLYAAAVRRASRVHFDSDDHGLF